MKDPTMTERERFTACIGALHPGEAIAREQSRRTVAACTKALRAVPVSELVRAADDAGECVPTIDALGVVVDRLVAALEVE